MPAHVRRGVVRQPGAAWCVSGFAALGYQIVWTQQSALWLGHEAAADARGRRGVLWRARRWARWRSAGASTRSRAAGALVRGLRSRDRDCGALALIFLAGPGRTRRCSASSGIQPTPLWHWFIAFSGTFVLLLPATAAMGATLPAMERILAAVRISARCRSRRCMSANTFGAVLGVLAAAFCARAARRTRRAPRWRVRRCQPAVRRSPRRGIFARRLRAGIPAPPRRGFGRAADARLRSLDCSASATKSSSFEC